MESSQCASVLTFPGYFCAETIARNGAGPAYWATKTKYKFDWTKILVCSYNKDVYCKKNRNNYADIKCNILSRGDSPETFGWFLYDIPERCLWDLWLRHSWAIVMWPLVPPVRNTGMLMWSYHTHNYVITGDRHHVTPVHVKSRRGENWKYVNISCLLRSIKGLS